ncbi:MAG: hypothetical protein E7413_01080 [Ruminococcaceae bacterium]|nr:hypothetical protein [Oscillospiraceae bacterium]
MNTYLKNEKEEGLFVMKLLAFGEILFDCYPTAKKIGGAPFNFCAHLTKLGANCALYGAVGDDDLGEEAISFAKKYGVDTRFLAKHPTLPTGVCNVTYQKGEPCYDLSGLFGYDEISLDTSVFSETYDIFYFGTLALRGETSRKTCETLLEKGDFGIRFFDMNLRQHYYTDELIKWGLSACDIVKMNRDEFFLVKDISSLTEEEIAGALEKICRIYHIKTAIFTLDADGACLWDKEQGFFRIPAQKTEFVSAVGAGDSFCACFLYHYKQGHPLPVCLEKASILAGYVVAYEEAIPDYSVDFLTKLQSSL